MLQGRKIRLIFLILLFFIAWRASSYDNLIIHPSLTNAAVEVYKRTVGKDLTKEKINWIIDGSIAEDIDPRYLNHFFNPSTGQGLSDGMFFGMSAKKWAQGQASASGDYSEPTIIKNYREGNEKRAYQGIGHILHLLQDMSVPAHTRNDSHPDGDPYEKWAKQYGQPNLSRASFLNVGSLDKAFDELAGHSHYNFFSKDTIVVGDMNKNYSVIEEEYNKVKRKYAVYNDYKLFIIDDSSIKTIFKIDEDFSLNLDYWNMLSPKAIGYSAGVIDYFIKQFEEIDKEKENQKLSLWDKAKIDFSNLTNNLKYNWGDTFLAARVQGKKSLAYISGKSQEGEQQLQFFVKANKEIIEDVAQRSFNIATDASGRVLSAIESPIVLGNIFGINPSEGSAPVISESEIINENKEPILNNLESEDVLVDNNIPVVKPAPIIFAPQPLPTLAPVTGSDSASPETFIVNAPNKISSSTEANFTLLSSENDSEFEYNLNDFGWLSCAEELNLTALPEGSNNLKARAIDVYNNVDESPEEYDWVIDITAPVSSIENLESEYEEIGFLVNWSGDDAGSSIADYDLEYRVNDADWIEWINATTSTSTIFNINVDAGSNIYFRVRARDRVGNIGEWSDELATAISQPSVNHLVISEVQISGENAKDEFVELYNPTDSDISLAGYKLKRQTASTSEYMLVSSFSEAEILAHGYYLITHPTGYAGAMTTDLTYSSASYSVASDNAVILYNGDEIIDKVGFGTVDNFETLAYPANPSSGKSLERKANENSTAESLAIGGNDLLSGNGHDSDDNSLDFVLQDTPNPQNSFSPIEPRDSLPIIPNVINDLIIQHNYTTNTSVKLFWSTPDNANLGEGAYYDFRYAKKNGDCNLLINWNNATQVASSSLSIPSEISGEGQSAIISDLDSGSAYCFAIKTFNGESWSNISNQVSKTTLASASSCTPIPLRWDGTIPTQTFTVDKSPYCLPNNAGRWTSTDSVLTIEPGVVFKFGSGAYILSGLNSNIIARGTKQNPIVFTSLKDDSFMGDTNGDGGATSPASGDWGSLQLKNIIDFDYVMVKYGGSDRRGVITFYDSNSSITNSEFSYNARPIVYKYDVDASSTPAVLEYNNIHDNGTGVMTDFTANPNIRYNTFSNNSTAIHVRLNSDPTINNNNFLNNNLAVEAADNYAGGGVNARENYWGDASGPTHSSNSLGEGDTISDNVDYGDFLVESY